MDRSSHLNLLKDIGFSLTEEDLMLNAQKMVVVGMSGGVDSSVTALVTKLLGYKTVGVFMKNWEEAGGVCTSEADWADVQKVAHQLEIPAYSVNFSEQYKNQVFATFLKEYQEGHTPNPDILCNREIKFKVFSDYAQMLGADFVATGHYCRKEIREGKAFLLKGVDAGKDQSYFLHAVDSKALENVLFPVGHIPKKKVRELAAQFKLATQSKKDSTGVCFIGERDFKEFLQNYIQSAKGHFVDLEGNALGPHDGVCFYTIGQRKGLGVGGPGGPWFVAQKRLSKNEVVLVEGEDHPALFSDELWLSECHWITERPQFPLHCKAKIRYRQMDQACVVSEDNGRLRVSFPEAQRAITLRQSVVFYDGEVCLGGGPIEEVAPSFYERSLPEFGVVQIQ